MRAICVSILTVALAVGSTGGVLGQANDELTPAVFVTGTTGDTKLVEDKGTVTWEQEVEWSDPRLPASLRASAFWYVSGPSYEDGVMTVEMNLVLEDAEGLWRGTGRGVETDDDRYSYYELVGEGAYESMHLLLRGAPGHDANGPHDEEYEGWLFESEPPPSPDIP